MLLGVLRLPLDCWDESELGQLQRHSRYLEAADRIELDEMRIRVLEQRLSENSALQWTTQRPAVPGFYWCSHCNNLRMVRVWTLGDDPRLFTNEDGGAAIEDDLYLNTYWYGPIQAPEFQP